MPKEGRAAEGGLPQLDSPSSGELLRGDPEGVRQALSLGSGLLEAAEAELRGEVVGARVPWEMGLGASQRPGLSETSLGVSWNGH